MKILRAISNRLRTKSADPAGPFIKLGSAVSLTGDSTAGNTSDGSELKDYNKAYDTQSP